MQYPRVAALRALMARPVTRAAHMVAGGYLVLNFTMQAPGCSQDVVDTTSHRRIDSLRASKLFVHAFHAAWLFGAPYGTTRTPRRSECSRR